MIDVKGTDTQSNFPRCRRAVDWFKGILKAVLEILKRIFNLPRKSKPKPNKQNNPKCNKNNKNDKPDKNDKNKDNKENKEDKKDKNKPCDDNDEGMESPQEGQESSDCCENQGDGNEVENSKESGESGDSGSGEDQGSDSETSGSPKPYQEDQQAIDEFHERVNNDENSGELSDEIVEVTPEVTPEVENSESVENTESTKGSKESKEPKDTEAIYQVIPEKIDPVKAALLEAFGQNDAVTGKTSGSEIDIDVKDIKNVEVRRTTVIPNQERERKAVYD